MLESNIFHSIDRCDDASYSESIDEQSVYFNLIYPELQQKDAKFLFTFMNEYQETVNLLLELSEDYSIKTQFMD